MTVTNEELLDLIKTMESSVKLQLESINFKIEKLSLVPTAQKRTVVKKPKDTADTSAKPPANAMYWWKKMFVEKNDLISKEYTEDDMKTAEDSLSEAKSKGPEKEKLSAIALSIYKTFDKDKKQNIKSMYVNWKKEQVKNTTVVIGTEPTTDDDTSGRKPINS